MIGNAGMVRQAARLGNGGGSGRAFNIGKDRSGSDLHEIQEWTEARREEDKDWEDMVFLWRERHDGTLGQHYWRFDARSRAFDSTPVPPWRSEWTAPFCFSIVDEISSRVSNTMNAFFGVPASDDSDDIASGQAVTRYARYLRHKEKLVRKRRRAARLQCIDGMHFYKARWDALCNTARIDAVPGWEIRIDPWATSLDQAQRVVHEQFLHIDVVRRMWGARRKSTLADIETDAGRIPWEIQRRFEAIRGGWSRMVPEKLLDGIVQYLEVHERPTLEYPLGRLRVSCNDVMLFDSKKEGHPYALAGDQNEPLCVPFVQGAYETPEGRFRGNGVIALIWDSVQLIEKLVNQAIEHNASVVWPSWFLDNSMKAEAKMSTEPGRHYYYDSGAVKPPTAYTPNPMSPAFMQLPQFMINLVYDHVGTGDGSAPFKRADTATAVAIAAEINKNRTQSLHIDLDEQERDAMWMAVQLERHFGSGTRHAQVIGRGRVSEVFAFENADLAGTQSLFVTSAVSLSDNKQLRLENVRSLVKDGFLAMEDALDYIDMPPPEDERADLRSMNMRVAQNNILAMKKGELPQIEETWDLPTHYRAMRRFIGIDADWWDLAPEIKQQMRQYAGLLQAHMTAGPLGAKMAEQLGGGPGDGNPTPTGLPGDNSEQSGPILGQDGLTSMQDGSTDTEDVAGNAELGGDPGDGNQQPRPQQFDGSLGG